MERGTVEYRPQTNWFLNGVFALIALAVLLALAPIILKNISNGMTPVAQATAIVMPTRAISSDAPPVNNGVVPTTAPAAGSPPDVIPTPAPLEAAPAIGGLTESMERKFEETTNPGVAEQILGVVDSWSEATPIPGLPPEDNGGGKSLGRRVDGGTSGGKSWEPNP